MIPKGRRLDGLEDSAAYRPVCLLDTLGKLYEQLIKGQLEDELETGGRVLSDRQYGFRKEDPPSRVVRVPINSKKR